MYICVRNIWKVAIAQKCTCHFSPTVKNYNLWKRFDLIDQTIKNMIGVYIIKDNYCGPMVDIRCTFKIKLN